MDFLKRIALIFLVSIFLVLTSFYFIFEYSLKPLASKKIQELISQNLKSEFKFDTLNFNLLKLISLKPSLEIQGINLANKQKIESILLDLSLSKLLKKEILIKRISIIKPELKIFIKNNGEGVLEGLDFQNPTVNPKSSRSEESSNDHENFLDSVQLELFEIKNGMAEINFQNNSNNFIFQNINLSLKDFHLNKNSKQIAQINFKTSLFESDSSEITYSGELEPEGIDLKSLKSTGDLNLTVLISDIPENLRKEFFGNLILAPSSSDSIKIKAKLSGDLLKDMKGRGDFVLNNLHLGKNSSDYLSVSSDFSSNLSFNLVEKQIIQSEIPDFVLEIKDPKNNLKGYMKAALELTHKIDTGRIFANGNGSISNVDINNALSAFTDYEDLLRGTFQMPFFKFSFNGRNDKELLNSLISDAHIDIQDGSLYLLDEILKYEDIASQILVASGTNINLDKFNEAKSKRFGRMSSDIKFQSSTLYTNNIDIHTSIANIKGDGLINPKQNLNYNLVLRIEGLSKVIPIKIKGHIEKPRLEADLNRVVQDNASDILNGLLKQISSPRQP